MERGNSRTITVGGEIETSLCAHLWLGRFVYTLSMLFMVIERFKNGDPRPVGERFKVCGRMLPEGVTYQASWIEKDGSRCFQIMEAPSLAALNVWVGRWDDLVDFDITPVMTSADFWAEIGDGL